MKASRPITAIAIGVVLIALLTTRVKVLGESVVRGETGGEPVTSPNAASRPAAVHDVSPVLAAESERDTMSASVAPKDLPPVLPEMRVPLAHGLLGEGATLRADGG